MTSETIINSISAVLIRKSGHGQVNVFAICYCYGILRLFCLSLHNLERIVLFEHRQINILSDKTCFL